MTVETSPTRSGVLPPRPSPTSRRRIAALAALALAPVIANAAVTTAHAAGSGIVCPERVKTAGVSLADPAKVAGFKAIVGGLTTSQTWLQDVAVFAGGPVTGPGAKGTPQGKTKIAYAFDGKSDVTVACVYEGGVYLTKAVGKVKACTASIKPSKGNPDAGGWGMETASFACK